MTNTATRVLRTTGAAIAVAGVCAGTAFVTSSPAQATPLHRQVNLTITNQTGAPLYFHFDQGSDHQLKPGQSSSQTSRSSARVDVSFRGTEQEMTVLNATNPLFTKPYIDQYRKTSSYQVEYVLLSSPSEGERNYANPNGHLLEITRTANTDTVNFQINIQS